MKSVFKYQIDITDVTSVQIEANPQWLPVAKVAENGRVIWLWALVDPDAALHKTPIFVHGTGHPVPESRVYIATAIDPYNPFVWHVFR